MFDKSAVKLHIMKSNENTYGVLELLHVDRRGEANRCIFFCLHVRMY
jgi:hypothetical protein